VPASITLFNHTAQKFANGSNAFGDVYRITLYSAFTFDATATTKAAAETGATQLPTANGYIQNDEILANVTVWQNGNDAYFDADDVVWTATGGAIAAIGALIYNDSDTNDPPVAWIDFGGTETAGDGTDFKIIWNTAGIITFTVT
jgi:hypothetical protein